MSSLANSRVPAWRVLLWGGGSAHPPPAARHFGVPRGDVQSPCARCWPFQTRVGVAAGAIRATNSWDPVSGTRAHKQGERGAAPHSLRHRRVCAPLLSGADSSRGRNQAVTPVVAGQVNSALSRRARAPGHPDSTQGQRGPSGDQRGPATGGPAFAGAARARRGKARPPARGAPTRTERLTLRLCVGFTTQTSCPAAEKTRLAL